MAYQTPIASTTNYGVVKVGSGISVTNGVISTTQGIVNTYLVTGASPTFAALSTDYYIGVIATGTTTITLPTGIQGQEMIIKSESGNTSDIQVNPQAGEFVEGSALGYLITPLGENPSITVLFRDTNWNVV